MNLDELRAVQNRERATDSLQELRDSFYGDVADYISDLKAERERVAADADDPFASPTVSRLTDEITMAEQVVEAIYERRVGKIVKHASLAAAGMRGDEEGLTREEQALYEDLVERIQDNKSHVLDVLSGEADSSGDLESQTDATDQPDPPDPPPDDDPSVNPADLMSAEADDSHSSGERPEAASGTDGRDDESGIGDVDRTTVRVTRDVGEIVGVDERVYRLEAEDVVTLPAANAAPLVEREAAEKLE